MHPIERLRFVARSQGAPAELLVEEAAGALGAFRDDPAGMVAACRRIIDRQLTCAPLWWLCARILCAPEPMREAHAAVADLDSDPTAQLLAAELIDDGVVTVVGWPAQIAPALRRRGDVEVLLVDTVGEADEAVRQLQRMDVDASEVPARGAAQAVLSSQLLLLDALAVGPEAVLVPSGSLAAAAMARHAQVPVWVVAGAGRLLPARMFEALHGRWIESVDPLEAAEELLPLELVDRVAGIGGVLEPAAALQHTDCPVAPELFRLAG
ncbi:MAG: hypothetical protein ACYC2O_07080 [Microthrixaceae bacterium]